MMSKPSLRSLALGFFLSAVIVFSYTTFIYKAPVADSSEATQRTKENTEEEKTYKEKYEELLAKTEVNEKKDSSANTASKDSSADAKKEEEKKEEAKKEEEKPEEDAAKEITLVINPGEPSSNAIQELADQNIIKSSEEFTKFLSDNDYETLVRDGSYKVNSKMTYEEIAKIITHSN